MTVAELIKQLQHLPPEMPVCVDDLNASYEQEATHIIVVREKRFLDSNKAITTDTFVSIKY